MKHYLIFVLLFIGTIAMAQRTQVNIGYAHGPLYFFNPHGGAYALGSSRHLNFNLFLNRKQRVMVFRPGFSFVKNVFNNKTEEGKPQTQVEQFLYSFQTDVLMRVSKRVYVKTGLFFSSCHFSTINVIYRQNSNYYAYGNSNMTAGYSANTFQPGVCAGVSIPFKIKKAELKFEVSYMQYATSVVNADYYNPALKNIETRPVLTAGAKPSVLLFSLEIAVRRLEKPVKKREEEE